MDDIELDSDKNEDPNREWQLDQSFEEWYSSIEDQVLRQQELTRVPQESVFDVVADDE